jgi:hypothetical protein
VPYKREKYTDAEWSALMERKREARRRYGAANREQVAAYNKRYRDENRSSIRNYNRKRRQNSAECRLLDAASHRRRALWSLCGIGVPQYEAASAALDGKCAICEQACPTGNRLAVDHDHGTGAYRGLLCMRCNIGLGKFRDRPDLLRKAADYLEAGGSPAFDIVTFLKETWSGRDD